MIAPEWVSVGLRVAVVGATLFALGAYIGDWFRRIAGDMPHPNGKHGSDLRISMKGVQELERRERRAKEQDRR